jgi:hypothetical protein
MKRKSVIEEMKETTARDSGHLQGVLGVAKGRET